MSRNLGAAAGLVGLQAPLDNAQALIHLLRVDFGPGRYAFITDDTASHTLNGDVYNSFPIEVGDYFEAADGAMTKVNVTIHDLFNLVEKEVSGYRGFDSWTVDFKACWVPGEGVEPVIVIGWNFNVSALTLGVRNVAVELGQDDLELLPLPHRSLSSNHCQAVYKGPVCGSTHADVTCSHALRDPLGCVAKDNFLRYMAQWGSGGP